MSTHWRRLIVPGIAAALALAVLVSLGVWQLRRLAWKEALIARVTERVDAAPIPAPGPKEWPDLELADLEYQPVSVTGRFLHQYEAHLFTTLNAPRGHFGGMGYFIMTPLETDDGWFVYVNRGFVPEDRKYAATRPLGQIDGEVTVTGLYRAPRRGSWVSPADDTAANIWFSRDPGLFAEWRGPPAAWVAPYTIDARFDPDLPGGLPQGGETLIDFPNNHLGYALTWFGLAAALIGVFLTFARGRLRGR
jgi:surfeit locus 1 family protein